MIPAAFGYVRAGSVDEAVDALAAHGDEARLLAGGHSLIPLMRLRLAAPSVLVDVGRVDELRRIDVDGDTVRIGALTRHSDLEHSEELARACPMLGHVASLVGDPPVRHCGTLGGSLAHADPASDLPATLLALGGTLVARGLGGEREIAADDFFKGFLQSALAPDEMLTEIRVPATTEAWAYEKFNRRAQDWAVVAVAVAHSGRRIAFANMGPTPLRASTTEEALAAGAGAEAADRAADDTEPPSDLNGDAGYRRHLAGVLTRRALETAGLI